MAKLISTNRLYWGILRIPKNELLALAAGSDCFYTSFLEPKLNKDGSAKLDKNGVPKMRLIEYPNGYMKSVQKLINRRILRPALDYLPDSVLGGRCGCTIRMSAATHSKSEALIKYDFDNFFPSIKYNHVYGIFRHRLNFCEESANILALLTTYESEEYGKHVPQGAPTSTNLALLAIERLCNDLSKLCTENSLNFSSWIDDLTISGTRAKLASKLPQIENRIRHAPFRISDEKYTGIMMRKSSKIVNGKKEKSGRVNGVTICANGDLSLGHGYYHLLRRKVKEAKVFSPRLCGKLQYLADVCPRKGRPLLREYLQKCPRK